MADQAIRDALQRALAPARADAAFRRRIHDRIRKDKPILDRLAEQERGESR